ncbi:MAG: 3-hydroxyacyl-ACP dehydratase FabZ family protein [Planctomycetota bacterium]
MAIQHPLIDPRDHPLDKIFLPIEEIRRFNPQRHEFEQLTAVLSYDREENLMVSHRHVAPDEFWMRGHIPGRPLFPGALMIESMAQSASIQCHIYLGLPPEVFIGFGGVDGVRFRKVVQPPCDLWIAGTLVQISAHRLTMRWRGQILTGDGAVVCGGTVLGIGLPEKSGATPSKKG